LQAVGEDGRLILNYILITASENLGMRFVVLRGMV
jgi:hypothetical protein